ncbi:MAG: DUF1456 family protein [Candidatus Zophobacter franzmannii]|jgi:uncharacterized protein YehS (DUF1456 family)|nr:DUF1456 family protein [Candidatus Zophobacter franzmannii]
MTNNDILRRLRYTFSLNDTKMMLMFKHVGSIATREQISAWLKKDDDPDLVDMTDAKLALFLDGFIVENRGVNENSRTVSDGKISNNIVLRKLKIAMKLEAEDMIGILRLSDFTISKHELSAFFRRYDHKHYRRCNDQLLRRFLNGLQKKYHRGEIKD